MATKGSQDKHTKKQGRQFEWIKKITQISKTSKIGKFFFLAGKQFFNFREKSKSHFVFICAPQWVPWFNTVAIKGHRHDDDSLYPIRDAHRILDPGDADMDYPVYRARWLHKYELETCDFANHCRSEFIDIPYPTLMEEDANLSFCTGFYRQDSITSSGRGPRAERCSETCCPHHYTYHYYNHLSFRLHGEGVASASIHCGPENPDAADYAETCSNPEDPGAEPICYLLPSVDDSLQSELDGIIGSGEHTVTLSASASSPEVYCQIHYTLGDGVRRVMPTLPSTDCPEPGPEPSSCP